MHVDTRDLVRAFQGNGDAFESFVHDLVRAVARSSGVDPLAIHWDHRTNVADGGRDLVVDAPNPHVGRTFLPVRPSMWSLKSGEDGVRPDALKREVRDPRHPKVRDGLKNGRSYVWCTVHPAAPDQRDAMRDAANEVAEELGVDRGLIEFRMPDHLRDEANLNPNVIAVHLADVADRLADLLLLREWGRTLDLGCAWVEFGGRGGLIREVSAHLLGRAAPNVLHLAGLSGIGKSRLVYEACASEADLAGVLYLPRWDDLSPRLYRYLEEDGRRVYLVVDETPLPRVDDVIARLRDFADRVRVVSLGPAKRQTVRTRDEIRVLPEPDSEAGVLEVVRAAGPDLQEGVLHSIAVQSGHDLRLALLLVRASQRGPEFRGLPVEDAQGIWARLMTLFGDEVGDVHQFRRYYEVLTASIDVGVAGDVGDELGVLAKHFEHPVEHVRDAATSAARCGLGVRTRHFFEASPRALAVRLFEERVWPRIRDRLDEFLLRLPERLGRRFLERCHDCVAEPRKEVMARTGDFFLRQLAGEDVTALASGPSSRLFHRWAEFDPERGLAWLRQAIEHADAEHILALRGDAEVGGHWGGRREIVWLCQNLASFAEYFEACESVLFRLALHETEPSIGNNGTAIWQSLFWPILAGTEVPFVQRVPLLLQRLRSATPDELPLVLSAAIGCVEWHHVGQPLPPRVVGGRVVPPPWRPATYQELNELRRGAGQQILDAIAALPPDRLLLALAVVAASLHAFFGLGLVEHLRALFRVERLDEALRRRLAAAVENHTAQQGDLREGQQPGPELAALREWLQELAPQGLAGRLRDLTSREYWSPGPPEEREAAFVRHAEELIGAPETLRSLAEWFDSGEARSGGHLAFLTGRRDERGELASAIEDWARTGCCLDFTTGYMGGIASREGRLPDHWADVLDVIADGRPEYAARLTVSADMSGRGFDRLLRLLTRLPKPASRFLRPLAYGDWLNVLQVDQRTRAAEHLDRMAAAGDAMAAGIGLELIHMWGHTDGNKLDPSLVPLAISLVRRQHDQGGAVDQYIWREVLRLLCPHSPRLVAELVIERLTEPDGSGGRAIDESVQALVQAAALDPPGVMEEVGRAVLDRKRRTIFGVAVMPGLFEGIGPAHIAAWLERNGREHLRWLSRHFPAPYVNLAGQPELPPITDWFFRERGDDEEAFSWFLMGRHSSTGFISESDVDPARERREMEPFLRHELPRVRQWAEEQIRHAERNAAHFRELGEEDERR